MIKPIDAARELYALGFVVLPAAFRGKEPYANGARLSWKAYQTTRPSEEEIERWFSVPICNFWILCGKPSGIVVADCDSQATLDWATEHIGADVLDVTPAVRTTKGWHFYFRLAEGEVIPQWSHHGDGIDLDVRSDGGGVVCPPSVHKSGAAYRWLRHPRDYTLQPVPDALRRPLSASAAPDGPEPSRSTLASLLASPAAEGGRNEWLARVAGHYAKQLPHQDAYEQSVRLAAKTLRPPLPEIEVGKLIRSIWGKESGNGKGGKAGARDLYTDVGNARRYGDHKGELTRYQAGKALMGYVDENGTYIDNESAIMQMVLGVVAEIYDEAEACDDPKERAKILQWAKYASSARGIRAMLEIVKADPRIQAMPDDFDKDPMLLNVRNGVVDLETGALLPHSPRYMMTKVAGTVYDCQAKCPLWEAHLERILAGDRAMIEFFQRLCGYAATGYATEQKMAILYGSGANGKSVTVETLRYCLGEYAETTDFKTFISSRSDGPRNDLAKLAGSRFVTASEGGARQWLDEAVVKQVTGGEPVQARFLHREFFTYTPRFTVFLSTNHRPNIEGVDRGLWRRILLVPFTVTLPESEWDRDLPEKLKDEMPGILNWIIVGAMMWRVDGLNPPLSVQMATAEYRADSDVVGQFIDEHLAPNGADSWVLLTEVHGRYQDWSRVNGFRRMSAQQLAARLREHDLEVTKDAPGSHRARVRGHSLQHLDSSFFGVGIV